MGKKHKRPAAKAAPADYEVGYGKPPVSSRWGPGQSGNPGGRKTGQRNFKSMVREIFEAEIEVGENGRQSKRTVAEALLLTLVHGGLKDRDIRFITRALDLYERFADKADPKEVDAPDQHDLDIIRRALHGDDPGRDDHEHDDDVEADKEDSDDGDGPDPADGV